MLDDVTEVRPSFMRAPASKTTFFQGACQTREGRMSYSDQDPHGYESCIDRSGSGPGRSPGSGRPPESGSSQSTGGLGGGQGLGVLIVPPR